jgi:hypothetical protein
LDANSQGVRSNVGRNSKGFDHLSKAGSQMIGGSG